MVRTWGLGYFDEDESRRLLVASQTSLACHLETDDKGFIVIPREVESHLEREIELFGNLLAVSIGCSRTITSPFPWLAFEPDGETDLEWLKSTKGPLFAHRIITCGKQQFDLTEDIVRILSDRQDGLAILAEANGHAHPTAKLREFVRFLERAFACSSTKLADHLVEYLSQTDQGFTKDEVLWLVKGLRDQVTHADRREEVALERDTRPYAYRLEQVAYDVLLNKSEWRTPSSARANNWCSPIVNTGGLSIRIIQGTTPVQKFQLLDGAGAFPMYLGKGAIHRTLPANWWTGVFSKE